jgi:ABC-type multidrug transport system ATPase subunit
MPGIIDVSQLVKTYGDGTKAVKGITFSVNEGEFFGFLGPNGAGKSTTIKILTTLLPRTSGSASVAGFNVDSDAPKIRKIIGVQNQDTVVDEDLTGRENLILQGQLQQMHSPAIKERVDELLRIVDLVDAADKRAGFYSGGMKKRLDLATTLVHNPKILFLDEPTTGLDPQSRAAIWAYLKRLNEQGITIFITTQYLEEVDRLCRRSRRDSCSRHSGRVETGDRSGFNFAGIREFKHERWRHKKAGSRGPTEQIRSNIQRSGF